MTVKFTHNHIIFTEKSLIASITTSAVAMTSNIAVTGSCDGKINVYDMKAKKALGKINDLHDSNFLFVLMKVIIDIAVK